MAVRPLVEILPLTHPVRLVHVLAGKPAGWLELFDLVYIFLFIAVFAWLAIGRMKKRLIA